MTRAQIPGFLVGARATVGLPPAGQVTGWIYNFGDIEPPLKATQETVRKDEKYPSFSLPLNPLLSHQDLPLSNWTSTWGSEEHGKCSFLQDKVNEGGFEEKPEAGWLLISSHDTLKRCVLMVEV